MLKYVAKRLALLLVVLFIATIMLFLLLSMTPGDPADIILGKTASDEAKALLREELGLNQPLLTRYINYMSGLIRGDFGKSYVTRQPITSEIMSRFPTTMKLAIMTTLGAAVLGIILGVLSAIKQYSLLDNICVFLSLLGSSIPSFWLGIMLMFIFSLKLHWLPPSGSYGWQYWVLPVLTITLVNTASIARMTRSSMLDVVRQDYIRTARAKGQTDLKIITKHELPNALIPIITVLGLQFAGSLGGAILCETVFSLPGVGLLMVNSVSSRDYPMILACSILTAVLFALITLIVDVAYAFIDPRIRTQYSRGKKKRG